MLVIGWLWLMGMGWSRVTITWKQIASMQKMRDCKLGVWVTNVLNWLHHHGARYDKRKWVQFTIILHLMDKGKLLLDYEALKKLVDVIIKLIICPKNIWLINESIWGMVEALWEGGSKGDHVFCWGKNLCCNQSWWRWHCCHPIVVELACLYGEGLKESAIPHLPPACGRWW